MFNYLSFEHKIIGINIYWISTLIVGMFFIVFIMGGNLVNWHYLGFEILFPFYTAIGVTQWCKTRSDEIFDLIKAQSKSLFKWMLVRYTFIFCVISAFVISAMFIIQMIKPSVTLIELFIVYISTAFSLSSFGLLCSLVFKSQYTSTALCGVFWLSSLLAKSMIRYKFFSYFYLFIRFADTQNSIWFINKFLLVAMGIGLWIIIYILCVKRYII